jgi:hypothetical protein
LHNEVTSLLYAINPIYLQQVDDSIATAAFHTSLVSKLDEILEELKKRLKDIDDALADRYTKDEADSRYLRFNKITLIDAFVGEIDAVPAEMSGTLVFSEVGYGASGSDDQLKARSPKRGRKTRRLLKVLNDMMKPSCAS